VSTWTREGALKQKQTGTDKEGRGELTTGRDV